MSVNGIMLVSLYCEVCGVVSRLVTWARCLPVAKAESRQLRLLLKSESSLQRCLSLRNL